MNSNSDYNEFDFEEEGGEEEKVGSQVGGATTKKATDVVVSTVGSSASVALALLLREDPLLMEHGLVVQQRQQRQQQRQQEQQEQQHGDNGKEEDEQDAAFAYAASLLKHTTAWNNNKVYNSSSNSSSKYNSIEVQATEALADVEHKLILVESLAERISREKPEDVAGPLLRLHGYHVNSNSSSTNNSKEDGEDDDGAMTSDSSSSSGMMTLANAVEKCERLCRQGEVLEGVSGRVESTLRRGLVRLERSTNRLQRVLHLSSTLKMAMRLRFEAKKIAGFTANNNFSNSTSTSSTTSAWDLRDLIRAAASVAIMEDLLQHPDFNPSPTTSTSAITTSSSRSPILLVERMKPEAQRVAAAVREAASHLLAQIQNSGDTNSSSSSSSTVSLSHLGATLQVYFHLGELGDATWKAVTSSLDRADKACAQLLNPTAIQRIIDSAKRDATQQHAADTTTATSTTNTPSGSQKKEAMDRMYKRKLRQKRADATAKWATAISQAALQVWNLHRVLTVRTDPTTRQNFYHILQSFPIPEAFQQTTDNNNNINNNNNQEFSIFRLFWKAWCARLGTRLIKLLKYENGLVAKDVSDFYPSIRSAALGMLSILQETMLASTTTAATDEFRNTTTTTATTTTNSNHHHGIMGGSQSYSDALFYQWTKPSSSQNNTNTTPAVETGLGSIRPDSWTRAEYTDSFFPETDHSASNGLSSSTTAAAAAATAKSSSSAASIALSSIFASKEWTDLEGSGNSGLYPLQVRFLDQLKERLSEPIQYLFAEAIAVDENGVALPVLPNLPSRYDMKQIQLNIKDELSLADPREGGGDLSMTTMVAQNVVHMVESFCQSAAEATSDVGDHGCLNERGLPTDGLIHDLNIARIFHTLSQTLRRLPEETFVLPYRPAHSMPQEEAANMCQIALLPALHEIESTVKHHILNPLCKALNRRIATEIAKMHKTGIYLQANNTTDNQPTAMNSSFVEQTLSKVYDDMATNVLSKLPTEYSSIVGSTIVAYSLYCFVSNASLVRPMGEMGRLRITQDLADFELALEQFVVQVGSSTPLNQVDCGKPYAELRAVRQMLFWNGLTELSDKSASIVAKQMLREAWIKDVRPSTAFHFLFSFAPRLLSSPHHAKGMDAEQYISTLIQLNASVDDGESQSLMTTMSCCDAYQQRESATVTNNTNSGDHRVASILMIIGPELIRRRRQ